MPRQVEVAPGITMSASAMPRTDVQVAVEHFVAGHAVLTFCSESRPGLAAPKRYWEIETSFHGQSVRLHYDNYLLHTLDDALAYLVVLGARWLSQQPRDTSRGIVLEAMERG